MTIRSIDLRGSQSQTLQDNAPSFPHGLPPLTARQFKLGLVRNGITLATVEALITDDEDNIEWSYATSFERQHPLVASLSAVLGLSAAQVDAMWLVALSY